MCLAVPAQIIACEGETATVEINGIRRSANVALIDSPQVGDYVLLHAGFAIVKWSDADMREFEEIIRSASGNQAEK